MCASLSVFKSVVRKSGVTQPPLARASRCSRVVQGDGDGDVRCVPDPGDQNNRLPGRCRVSWSVRYEREALTRMSSQGRNRFWLAMSTSHPVRESGQIVVLGMGNGPGDLE